MAMNLGAALKLKTGWSKFTKEHPKFPAFIKAVQKSGINAGTVIEVKITEPDGEVLETNLKITESDLKLFESLKELGAGM